MVFYVSRQEIFFDGSKSGVVFLQNRDGDWLVFGLDGFCKLLYDFDMEAVSSFVLSNEENKQFEYVVYKVSTENFVLLVDFLS